jgi:hypothetical protein
MSNKNITLTLKAGREAFVLSNVIEEALQDTRDSDKERFKVLYSIKQQLHNHREQYLKDDFDFLCKIRKKDTDTLAHKYPFRVIDKDVILGLSSLLKYAIQIQEKHGGLIDYYDKKDMCWRPIRQRRKI